MNKYRAWDTRNSRMITTFGNDSTVFTSSGFHYVDLTANKNGLITADLMEHMIKAKKNQHEVKASNAYMKRFKKNHPEFFGEVE